MLSGDDIKKLLQVFAGKEDLAKVEEKVATKNQFNEVITKLDAVYGEVKDMREEQAVHLGQHERIDEEISSIKSRLAE